ncbi:MAG TPA: His/Gly/Thr/Pro-type tRNA ligase C-terminal domain-containing protein, partial [Nitrolancea sp.]|nr:His/Gly/Thr/Pro-type tRNA ligase C-terminal domain-containing protein [Nitrolancea sp.]
DIKFLDSLGREWTGPTVQVDWNLPERFDIAYINEAGKRERPVMVHRAVLGSLERFVGGLIEHFAGAFPVWIAPVQAEVIPIADRHVAYAEDVASKLRAAGLRVQVNAAGDRMQAKIRRAQLEHIPYMLVVGDKEIEAGAVAVRLRTNENLGQIPADEFIARAQEVVNTKALDLVPATHV